MKLQTFFLSISIAVSLLASCAGGGTTHENGENNGNPIPFRHARLITMEEHDGFTVATLVNPWDTTKILQTYILKEKGKEITGKLPAGGVIVEVPLERCVVFTDIHANLINELGAPQTIKGLCDAKYVYNPKLKEALKQGSIADCGNSMSPNVEKIAMLNPDAILVSAFENSSDHNKVAQTRTPIIDCTDYMEASPLARAEWMRFFGRLFGKGELSDSLFLATEKEYLTVKDRMAKRNVKPTVMFDRMYQGVWDVPGSHSTIGILLEDAGGSNPFSSYSTQGAVHLSPEEVMMKAHDSDIWIIRYFDEKPLSYSDLAKDNKIYTEFAPYKSHHVFGCNTLKTNYFYDSAFRPQKVLEAMAALLNPEQQIDSSSYFHPLQP